MDGVPVKISEKYKPRKKINLPGSVLNKISAVKDSKLDDYDFSFERSVIAKISQFREDAEAKRKKEESQKVEEAPEELSPEGSPETPASPVAVNAADSGNISGPITSSQVPILTPIPVYDHPERRIQRNVDNAFISEFESDTSSPFDNMELKSINDLQELADVLGTTSSDRKAVQPLNGITSHWNNNYYTVNNQFYPRYHERGGVGGYSRYPVMPSMTQQPFSHPAGMSPPFSSSYVPSVPPKPSIMSAYTPPVSHFYPSSMQQSTNSVQMSSPLHTTSPVVTSDLCSGLQSAIINRRSQETSYSPSTSGQLQPSQAVLNTPPVKSNLENPLNSLSSNGQEIAKKMSEMGFPLDRSARAVQFFSCDEAKVIEFLLQVQRFEDEQFPGDRVESAFIACNFDEEEAVKYLENVKKLMDLGFGETQVIEALRKNNDPDKALDALIS